MTLVIAPVAGATGVGTVRVRDWRTSAGLSAARTILRGLSWGAHAGRLSVFGSVNADDVGDFVAALESAAIDDEVASVDLHGLDVICAPGIQVLARWWARTGRDVTLDAPDDLMNVVRATAGVRRAPSPQPVD